MSKYTDTLELGQNSSSGKVIRFIRPGSTVLEFGPSSGRMTRYMKEALQCKVYIVELNEEDYARAICWAEDGIRGDIQQLTWRSRFSDIQFDHIVFADVLEHLTNASEVLEKTRDLLKDDGTVIVSVPNVTHNDVILSLLTDEFHYTQTGLLDNTHVLFMGHNDLERFFARSGYAIVREEYVYQQTFSTEQNIAKTKLAERVYKSFLRYRPYGEVYQFVLELGKQETKPEQARDRNKIAETIQQSMLSHIYYDMGNGYNEDDSRVVNITMADNGYFSCRIHFYKNVRSVRFDPVENMCILIYGIRAFGEYGEMDAVALNGKSFRGYTFFSTYDPQIEIRLTAPTDWIEISGTICIIDNPMMTRFIEKLFIEKLSNRDSLISVREAALCYYDKGTGFCAKDVVSAEPVPQVDGRNMYRFRFPQEVNMVRFDPVEGTGCLLTQFEARSHILPKQWISNGIQTSRAIVFSDEDPQIRIDFDEGIRELIVYAGVERINLRKSEEPA